MNSTLSILISCAASLAAVRWIYFMVLKIAMRKKILDCPQDRKLQVAPVPVMGGIAVFFGVLTGILVFMSVNANSGDSGWSRLFPIVCSMAIIGYIGAMDDFISLTPSFRLVFEIIIVLLLVCASGTAIDNFGGLWNIGKLGWYFAIPLTLFASTGIINAINMVDGVNGLSSSLCIMSLFIFGLKFVQAGCYYDAEMAFCTVASIVPFVIHNLFGKRSRMFLGDAGTMQLGLLLSFFVIRAIGSNACTNNNASVEGESMVAFTLAVLSVPVFDAIRVMILRMLRGGSPFSPDKTHLHHLFVANGFGHLLTTLSEVFLNLAVVAAWHICVKTGASYEIQLYVVILASVIMIWGVATILKTDWFGNTKLVKLIADRHEGPGEFRNRFYVRLAEILDKHVKDDSPEIED